MQSKSNNIHAFMNVREAYGSVQVWTAIHNAETYLMIYGQEVHLLQFDRGTTKEAISEFLAEYKDYKITKIEETFISSFDSQV